MNRKPLLIALVLVACSFSHAAEKAKPINEIELSKLIGEAGLTPPEWLEVTPLNYPKSLDLSWPQPKGGWNQNVNLGQYFHSVLRPRPEKWKEGVKLFHHVLDVNRNNDAVAEKAYQSMGALYYWLGDHARAAYCFIKAKTENTDLAYCYWKLGCKEAAMKLLKKIGLNDGEYCSSIMLYNEMDEFDYAQKLAARLERLKPDGALTAIGDAFRWRGKLDEAYACYEKVINLRTGTRRLGIQQGRATSSKEGIDALRLIDFAKLEDGVRTATASGYKGPVEVEVKVEKNKLTSVKVKKISDDQILNAPQEMPARIMDKGGNPAGLDVVSGATVTSNAIINATLKALAGDKVKEAVKAELAAKEYKDGTYSDSARGYKGDVKVTLRISKNKISYIKVVKHNESRPKNAIRAIPMRIQDKGGIEGVDVISGATITSRAILKAAGGALEKAEK